MLVGRISATENQRLTKREPIPQKEPARGHETSAEHPAELREPGFPCSPSRVVLLFPPHALAAVRGELTDPQSSVPNDGKRNQRSQQQRRDFRQNGQSPYDAHADK